MEQPIFSFLDDKLLTSFKNTPKLQDLKNDFSIHGIKRSPSGAENPIRARYAIDKKPTYYRAYDGMIYTTNEHLIDDMLVRPEIYISEDQDIVLLKVFGKDVSNPVMLMLGYDDKADSYYFVVEDNDISEDIYCATEKLPEMYDTIICELLKGGM
jgi:hypothetical protein